MNSDSVLVKETVLPSIKDPDQHDESHDPHIAGKAKNKADTVNDFRSGLETRLTTADPSPRLSPEPRRKVKIWLSQDAPRVKKT